MELLEAIKINSAFFDLDPKLVACVILQESSGDPWKNRYEDAFYNRYVRDKKRGELIGHVPASLPNLSTEKRNRAFSWGYMQVMGQTARELDFKDDSMTKLILPEYGVGFGCMYLRKCLAGRTVEKGLLKYNGGGNPDYGKEVLARYQAGEYTAILGKGD